MPNLDRFIAAQENTYATALAEIKDGRKRTHWMWFIFPQVAGLGNSETSKQYAITDMQEAGAYINHPVLGPRLIEISNALLQHVDKTASQVFGKPDDRKLRSSMTLFSLLANADPVFIKVLERFYNGERDEQTLALVGDRS